MSSGIRRVTVDHRLQALAKAFPSLDGLSSFLIADGLVSFFSGPDIVVLLGPATYKFSSPFGTVLAYVPAVLSPDRILFLFSTNESEQIVFSVAFDLTTRHFVPEPNRRELTPAHIHHACFLSQRPDQPAGPNLLVSIMPSEQVCAVFRLHTDTGLFERHHPDLALPHSVSALPPSASPSQPVTGCRVVPCLWGACFATSESTIDLYSPQFKTVSTVYRSPSPSSTGNFLLSVHPVTAEPVVLDGSLVSAVVRSTQRPKVLFTLEESQLASKPAAVLDMVFSASDCMVFLLTDMSVLVSRVKDGARNNLAASSTIQRHWHYPTIPPLASYAKESVRLHAYVLGGLISAVLTARPASHSTAGDRAPHVYEVLSPVDRSLPLPHDRSSSQQCYETPVIPLAMAATPAEVDDALAHASRWTQQQAAVPAWSTDLSVKILPVMQKGLGEISALEAAAVAEKRRNFAADAEAFLLDPFPQHFLRSWLSPADIAAAELGSEDANNVEAAFWLAIERELSLQLPAAQADAGLSADVLTDPFYYISSRWRASGRTQARGMQRRVDTSAADGGGVSWRSLWHVWREHVTQQSLESTGPGSHGHGNTGPGSGSESGMYSHRNSHGAHRSGNPNTSGSSGSNNSGSSRGSSVYSHGNGAALKEAGEGLKSVGSGLEGYLERQQPWQILIGKDEKLVERVRGLLMYPSCGDVDGPPEAGNSLHVSWQKHGRHSMARAMALLWCGFSVACRDLLRAISQDRLWKYICEMNEEDTFAAHFGPSAASV